MRIEVNLRDFDSDNNKIDNTKTEKEIIKFCNKYFNCESVGVFEE